MGTKAFWTSKTFHGLVVALASSIYVVASGGEPDDTVNSGLNLAVAQVLEWIGILVAFYGRWTATQPLSTTMTN